MEGPLTVPSDFHTVGFWRSFLQDWDRLPLIRPTHLEMYSDDHVKASSPTRTIRRLALTMPLSWACGVIAGMRAHVTPRAKGELRSTLPIFSADFALAPELPEEIRARHIQQATTALNLHPVPRRHEVGGSKGACNTARASIRRRMEPVARTSLKGPFAKEEVAVEVSPSGIHLRARGVPNQPGQRAPIDGLLMAVHPLSETAVLRECQGREREEKLTLCTPEPGKLARCSEEEIPAMEERRRSRAAGYLVTPAPAKVRDLFVQALLDPRSEPWPVCAPPCHCATLEAGCR